MLLLPCSRPQSKPDYSTVPQPAGGQVTVLMPSVIVSTALQATGLLRRWYQVSSGIIPTADDQDTHWTCAEWWPTCVTLTAASEYSESDEHVPISDDVHACIRCLRSEHLEQSVTVSIHRCTSRWAHSMALKTRFYKLVFYSWFYCTMYMYWTCIGDVIRPLSRSWPIIVGWLTKITGG